MNTVLINSPTTLFVPPEAPRENQTHNWFSLSNPDLVTDHINTALWDKENTPDNWQLTRLSRSVYIYHEVKTGWKIITTFHAAKTGKDGIYHAKRDHRLTQQAWECLVSNLEFRSVQPLGLLNGALLLEIMDGLTQEGKIVIRRCQPGELGCTARMEEKILSKLYMIRIQPTVTLEIEQVADYTHTLIDNPTKPGVLKNHPNLQRGLGYLVEKWATYPMMWDFQQTRNHEDATKSNFIFPPEGGIITIDWEQSEIAVPAADLGCLMAELAYKANQYGGKFYRGIIFDH